MIHVPVRSVWREKERNKTTRTFEHRGEAWRVLVGAKVVLFIESTKLFDGKLFFERRFCCFSISYERAVFSFAGS
jgi:hypothetical protein